MVQLYFYGGVGEIGGNKILLEDRDTRIFLDFGMSFAERRKFYSEPWLSPMDEECLLEFGILPKVRGLYRFDKSPPSIDAVFLTHSHADHSMYASFLNRKIPLYCGETTATLLQCMSETRTKGFETDLEGLEFRTFRTGVKISVEGIEIEPVHVDHSVPGSYGYIVYTSEGAIAYTGDFRLHGTKPQMSEEFIERAAQSKPLALLCEGTNVFSVDASSEHEVRSKLNEVMLRSSKLVLADFSYSDVDRFRTFFDVAKNSGRRLAISPRQAYVLSRLSEDRELNLPDVRRNGGILIYRKMKRRHYLWEREILRWKNVSEASDVRRSQAQTILLCSFRDFGELIEIRPDPGSVYVFSSSEPYNEEQAIDFEKLSNWLDHFGLPMYHVHCSGHILPSQLKQAVSTIHPKKLFPIHTEHPGLIARFMSDIAKVSMPDEGVCYKL